MIRNKQEASRNRVGKNRISPVKPWRWLLIIFILMAELFVYTGTRVECTNAGYEIVRAETVLKKNISYKKQLTIELERLSTPERISGIATTRLGLFRPGLDSVVYLGTGRGASESLAGSPQAQGAVVQP